MAAKVETVTGRSLLFELEGLAILTREAIFQSLKTFFKAQNVKFDVADFCRFGFHAVPEHLAAALTDGLKLKAAVRAALLTHVQQALAQIFGADRPALAPGLDKLVRATRDRGLDVIAISFQPLEAAEALLKKTGLDALGVKAFAHSEVTHEYPGADVWLRALKTIGQRPRHGIALTGCGKSTSSALSAGLRVLVVPDRYTGFQDFSGADRVAEAISDLDAAHDVLGA